MNIPGDAGHPWRLNKFVEYQHEVPSIHYRTIGYHADFSQLNNDTCVMLAWYLSVTYNEITAILLNELLDWKTMKLADVEDFWVKYKPQLDFGSARKYAKNMDWFVPLMNAFMKKIRRQPDKCLKSFDDKNPETNYKNLYKDLKSMSYVGRFAADIFMETVLWLDRWNLKEPLNLDWKNCANLTSGMFNIFYQDKKADLYDKNKIVTARDKEWLDAKILEVQQAIQDVYPEQNSDLMSFIGKICSFRNLFKNARYGGFHHDRQLGVLKEYEAIMPEHRLLWEYIYTLRRLNFPRRLLGECGGWDGIRKERKKLWTSQGLTGVEQYE